MGKCYRRSAPQARLVLKNADRHDHMAKGDHGALYIWDYVVAFEIHIMLLKSLIFIAMRTNGLLITPSMEHTSPVDCLGRRPAGG